MGRADCQGGGLPGAYQAPNGLPFAAAYGVRVVVEVDGKHHYANDEGRADASKYATMMAADRDLRLAGYEVFRFGASELSNIGAADAVTAFFQELFKRYRVNADR